MKSWMVAGSVLVLSVCLAATAEARKWTSAKGTFSVEAEYVSSSDGKVKLKKENGHVLTVPLSALSKADREFVESQGTGKPDKPTGGDDPEARKLLEGRGLRVMPSDLRISEESKLSKGLKEISTLQRKMFKANTELSAIEQKAAQNRQAINHLTQLNVKLNAQLAGVVDVTTNNKLVGAISANAGQIDLLLGVREQIEAKTREIRGKANQIREEYVQQILDLRKIANAVSGQYTKLGVDSEVREAVASLNKATGKSYQMVPSREFVRLERKLKGLEDTVLSEVIPLRRDRFDSLYASVMVNGKHTKEMLVDSGASSLALPHKVAREMGIVVTSQDPEIILVLANGDQIKAHQVTLPSVRVGKFTVENVDCAVFGEEAVAAEPLLGMSFLGNFKFEVDSQRATLTMVKIDRDGKEK